MKEHTKHPTTSKPHLQEEKSDDQEPLEKKDPLSPSLSSGDGSPESHSEQAKSKTSTEPLSSETSSPMTTLNNQTAKHKMIFLAMLTSAITYRKEYIDKDIEANRVYCQEMGSGIASDPRYKNITKGKLAKLQRGAAGMHHTFRHKAEKFDKVCGEEIEAVKGEFKILNEKTFQSYAEGFGSMIEQYLNAKSTGDILSVCQAYNAGLLDELLKVIQADSIEEKEEYLKKVEAIQPVDEAVVVNMKDYTLGNSTEGMVKTFPPETTNITDLEGTKFEKE